MQQALIAHCELHGRPLRGARLRPRACRSSAPDSLEAAAARPRLDARLCRALCPVAARGARATTARRSWCRPPATSAASIARSDASRGVHKAPANEIVNGALGVERAHQPDRAGPAEPARASTSSRCSRTAAARSSGARARRPPTRNWQYVNIRRLFLYLEESIQEGIRWAVFEPNNLALWQKLKRTHHRLPHAQLARRRAVRRQGRGGLLRAHRRSAQSLLRAAARAAAHRDRRAAELPGRIHHRPHRHLGRRLRVTEA